MPTEEYRRDAMELEAKFATEEACRMYLAQLGGRTVSAVRAAEQTRLGGCENGGSARSAGGKLRSRREPSCRTPGFRCRFGFLPCGG